MKTLRDNVIFIGAVLALCLAAGYLLDQRVQAQSGYIASQGLRLDSGGAQIISLETCPTTKTITVSATTTEILPIVAAKKNRICSYVVTRTDTAAVVATAKFVEGTGTNCASGQADLTGRVVAFASGAVGMAHSGPVSGLTANTAADAICVTEAGAASSMDITITYAPAY